jgi:signal peptidase I
VARPHDEDVVVFNAPDQALKLASEAPDIDGGPTDYIKRLMGTPGDTIEVVRGVVQIGSDTLTHSDLRRDFEIEDRDNQHVKLVDNAVMIYDNGWKRYTPEQVAEKHGTPGQAVIIHPGYVIRNNVKLSEPYTSEDPDYSLRIVDGKSVLLDPDSDTVRINGLEPTPSELKQVENAKSEPLPPGKVFVMGDNRNDSNDSTRWGPLDENRMVGKAFFIFYPFDRIHEIR